LYSFSKFPIIISENGLLLGSNFNANNSMQLRDMGVKVVLIVKEYPKKKDPSGKII